MINQKTKAERREFKKLKQKFAPKGATFAGQMAKMKTAKQYLKKKKS